MLKNSPNTAVLSKVAKLLKQTCLVGRQSHGAAQVLDLLTPKSREFKVVQGHECIQQNSTNCFRKQEDGDFWYIS